MFHQVLKQSKFAASVIITFQVMAFAGMSPGHPHAVRPLTQRRQKKFGAHPAGAGNPDNPDIGRIFHPADSRQVGGAVTAPVAQKGYDFRFPIGHVFNSP
jgi:hypothetical protein